MQVPRNCRSILRSRQKIDQGDDCKWIEASRRSRRVRPIAYSSHSRSTRGKWSTSHFCPTSSLSTSFVPYSFLKSKSLLDVNTHEDSEPHLSLDSPDGLGISNGWLHSGLPSGHRVGSVRGCCEDGISSVVQTIGDLGLCSETMGPPPSMCDCAVRPSTNGLMSLKGLNMLGPISPPLGDLILCIGCRLQLWRPASLVATPNVGLSNLAPDTVGVGWLWAVGDEMEKGSSAQKPQGEPEPRVALFSRVD